MRVRVSYTLNVDEDFRRALACYDGEHGSKADRERIQNLARAVGDSLDDDIMSEWEQCGDCGPMAREVAS